MINRRYFIKLLALIPALPTLGRAESQPQKARIAPGAYVDLQGRIPAKTGDKVALLVTELDFIPGSYTEARSVSPLTSAVREARAQLTRY